jgi:hypothetical protein
VKLSVFGGADGMSRADAEASKNSPYPQNPSLLQPLLRGLVVVGDDMVGIRIQPEGIAKTGDCDCSHPKYVIATAATQNM